MNSKEQLEQKDLFLPFETGPLKFKNRIIMAPLTRSRADEDGNPTPMMKEYYSQRAGAGMIISEATNISKEAVGYMKTPGIWSEEQILGWKIITDEVHQKGGTIFCQLWHCGRISHSDLQPDGDAPVSASEIGADADVFTSDGMKKSSTPRALKTEEIPRLISDYVHAATCAKKAGFDGVEVHSANGYLLHQFISDSSNKREDQYGGSIENRCRLTLEVIKAVTKVWGEERVAVRFGPVSPFNGVETSEPQKTYEYMLDTLNELSLAYVHVIEGKTGGDRDYGDFDYKKFRDHYKGTYMANNNYDLDLALKKRENNTADLICFGRPFIANPDLVERYKKGADLNEIDSDTLYQGGKKGYTDYPFLGE